MAKLLDVITGDDNKTLEPCYFLGTVFAMVGMGLVIYCTVTGRPAFDLQNYGIGAGVLLASVGGGKFISNRNANGSNAPAPADSQ